MTDRVTIAVEDIIDKLQSVSEIASKALYLYRPEEVADYTRKLVPPFVGVVYLGMYPIERGTRLEKADEVMVSLLLAGGDLCNSSVTGAKATATDILDRMRIAIRTTLGANELVWVFKGEVPTRVIVEEGQPEVLGYAQRWGTVFSDVP